ncbi:bacillithiol system redox-active protein YtxJ [candidate division KSB1 bacterium]|nr:bacillithiol system redox-active protein YtxJ [candidate division KSB1 bacterium]
MRRQGVKVHFHPLESIDHWQRLLSMQKIRFIFKQSPVCPISYSAERRVDKWLESLPAEIDLVYATVDVIGHRQVSQAIAKDLNIKHESPQAICMDKDGNVLWTGSHHQIQINALKALELKSDQNNTKEY